MSVSKSCLANTGQRAKKRDHHKYKRAHTSLDGVTTVEKDAMDRTVTILHGFFRSVSVRPQRAGRRPLHNQPPVSVEMTQ